MVDFKKLGFFGIAILLVAVIASVGSSVLDGMRAQTSQTLTSNAANEAWTGSNATVRTLLLPGNRNAAISWSSFVLVNNSVILSAANYTFSESAGTVVLTSPTKYLGASLYMNYTYTNYTGASFAALYNGTKSVGTLAEWLSTIAMVIAAAVIMGLLLKFRETV